MMKTESSDYPSMFIWKIENCSERIRVAKEEKNRPVDSAPFYTENYGYRLKVKLCPNGFEDSSIHISILIIIMRGEYDAILPWPFKRKVKLTLIDQRENSDYGRPQMQENLGFRKVLRLYKFPTAPYVADDTLFLQVELGPP